MGYCGILLRTFSALHTKVKTVLLVKEKMQRFPGTLMKQANTDACRFKTLLQFDYNVLNSSTVLMIKEKRVCV